MLANSPIAQSSATNDAAAIDMPQLVDAVNTARDALADLQKDDGHWVFELEADATIPAEYILLEHFLDRINDPLQQKLARYLRRIQGEHGGWPLYFGGKLDISASVKAYFALKAAGDSPQAPHMQRARDAILARGGAAKTNVFTRIQMALFDQVPWHASPVMPVELMLMPKRAFFSMWNMSYWSRTVVAPLLVLRALKAKATNPRGIDIRELFLVPPGEVTDWNVGPYRSAWGRVFTQIDKFVRPLEAYLPDPLRKRAIDKALAFIEPRLSDSGLGAIYPAMANVVMMYRSMGVDDADPRAARAWNAIQDLLVVGEEEAYCQPCVSPVWDTGLSGLAMAEAASGPQASAPGETQEMLAKSAKWLRQRQILDVLGDWAEARPTLQPGGWAFQYENDYYPDVDDTAVVGMLLHRQDPIANKEAIARAREWILGMQSTNGGWGAFDVDNNREVLNHIPFADHGALLDPPTADVSARCISFLAELGYPEDQECIAKGVAYLLKEQESDGSWFGRWGTNYIYGTWSALCALNKVGLPHGEGAMLKAVRWLEGMQRADGGWGEDCASYEGAPSGRGAKSLPSQTAWAVLALMAAGQSKSDAVRRGVAYLMASQNDNGTWNETPFNAVGFPKVFYLKYHGYARFFPLMALARYRNLTLSNAGKVEYGF